KAVITAPKPPPEKKVVKPASAARSDTNVSAPPKKAAAGAAKKPSTAPAAGEKRTAVRGGGGKKPQTASPQKEEILPEPPVEVVGDPSARVDIGSQMNDYLMNEFNDKNWIVRQEALDKVRNMLDTKKHIGPNLGDLPQNLANRMTDSNKNLALNAFLVCQNLAIALGPHCKTHIHTFLPNMLNALSDQKTHVRAQVLACIDAWAENAGLQKVFCSEFIADAIKTGNHFARTELFNWMGRQLPQSKDYNILLNELLHAGLVI
ncbi:Cytoskeleton-associated protein 5, partial [Orchesella cincta]